MYEDRLLELIISDKITWEGLIRDIVKEESINPWEIDLVVLVSKYVALVKKSGGVDLRSFGKFILTITILLRMKSDLLLAEKIEDEEYRKLISGIDLNVLFTDLEGFELYARVPPVRYRKVTVEDLVEALKKAFEVAERRKRRRAKSKVDLNIARINLMQKIEEMYRRVNDFFLKIGRDFITFSELVPSRERVDIIWTFIPLLYLDNEGKVNLRQDIPFGEIYVERGS